MRSRQVLPRSSMMARRQANIEQRDPFIASAYAARGKLELGVRADSKQSSWADWDYAAHDGQRNIRVKMPPTSGNSLMNSTRCLGARLNPNRSRGGIEISEVQLSIPRARHSRRLPHRSLRSVSGYVGRFGSEPSTEIVLHDSRLQRRATSVRCGRLVLKPCGDLQLCQEEAGAFLDPPLPLVWPLWLPLDSGIEKLKVQKTSQFTCRVQNVRSQINGPRSLETSNPLL